MESNNYIKKWLEGSLSEEEKKKFEASSEFKSLKKLTGSIRAFRVPEYDVERELNRLHLRKKSKGKTISISWMQPLLRIAAALFVILGITLYFYLNENTYIQTAASEKTVNYLPDSSKVILNAFTRISFKEKLWNYTREVKLDGEAFFYVAKGSKFDVETTSGTVSVLGTKFNVKNRENYFEVVCYEGLVQVESGNEISQLPPGNSLRIINGIIDKSTTLAGNSPSWINNESSFRSVPFVQVIREFERQYNVTISTSGVNLDQLFTGKFIHDDRLLALQSISLPLNLKFDISNQNQIILTGKGD